MPSQLPSMPDASGGDRHAVGSELPIDINEFADLLHFVQASPAVAMLEPQGQYEPFNAPLATIPSDVSASASQIAGQPMSSSPTQEKHGNDWVNFGWIDENIEHTTSWSPLNSFQV
jgi:hypothetical protein